MKLGKILINSRVDEFRLRYLRSSTATGKGVSQFTTSDEPASMGSTTLAIGPLIT